MKEYEVVRVRQRLRPADSYDGWNINQRPPQVGDVGTVVGILHAHGLPDHYVVECCGADGASIWLGDFLAEELEPVSA